MNKKLYITPETIVSNVLLEITLQADSNEVVVDPDTETDDEDDLLVRPQWFVDPGF